MIMTKEELDALKEISGWFCVKCGHKLNDNEIELLKERRKEREKFYCKCGGTGWYFGIDPKYLEEDEGDSQIE